MHGWSRALDRAAVDAGRRLRVLVQVNLAEDPAAEAGRGGADPADVLGSVRGPRGARLPSTSVESWVSLRSGRTRRRRSRGWRTSPGPSALSYPSATWVSAGMSADFGEAIRHGATHVRIGSALLGNRPPLR